MLRPWLQPAPPAGTSAQQSAARVSDTALRHAADALARNPADPHVLESLDRLYARLCDPATGEPDPTHAPVAVRRIAIILHNAQRDGTEPPLADEVLGKYALAGGYDVLATSALQRAKSRGVPADRVDVPLALALLAAGRYADVLQAAQPEAASSPQHRARLLTLQARADLGLSRYDAARRAFTAALAIDPQNADTLSRFGMLALWHDRDTAATAALLARARAASPDAMPTLRLAAEYDYATGDYRGSAAAYRALVRRRAPEVFDPIPPSLGEARALTYEGNLAAARAVLDSAPLPARDPTLRYYRALLAYRGGAFRRAAELAQSLDAAMPNYPPLHLLLGGSLLAAGYPATAAAQLSRYLAEVPADGAAQRLLQVAQRRLADPRTATVSARDLLVDFGFPLSAGTGLSAKDGF